MRLERAMTALLVSVLAMATASQANDEPVSQAFSSKYQAYAMWTPKACIVLPEPEPGLASETLVGGPVAVLIPALIDKAFDWLAEALEMAAKDESWTYSSTAGDYFYRYTRNAAQKPWPLRISTPCFGLLIVADDEAARNSWAREFSSSAPGSSGVTPEALKAQLMKTLPTQGVAPVAYFEFAVDLAEQGQAFHVRPTVAWVSKSLNSDDSKKRKDFAVTYKFSNLQNEVVAVGSILFPYLEPGTVLGPEVLAIRQSGWLPVIPLSKETETKKAELDKLDTPGDESLEPFNLTLALIETKNGIKWLQRVADFLRTAKKDALAAVPR